ncbi:hypothetical protein GMA11_02240 [Granulicatella sp. zg-ZJ]|uniref:hypothetical protein n=1 Tax=Granulicatella sp. zg-ZJ TaxID=2678504 RepID=UPI0013D3DC09|nr:hypothetical protein [Granulicatella sp. zg-ZJ]MBS4749477.1 hypothetical protein [Carnobacteriaceae bacterium zg-ZUI78]NEW62207.1 hypothetical protein [Granulicatella sp. zg-ZJ]
MESKLDVFIQQNFQDTHITDMTLFQKMLERQIISTFYIDEMYHMKQAIKIDYQCELEQILDDMTKKLVFLSDKIDKTMKGMWSKKVQETLFEQIKKSRL